MFCLEPKKNPGLPQSRELQIGRCTLRDSQLSSVVWERREIKRSHFSFFTQENLTSSATLSRQRLPFCKLYPVFTDKVQARVRCSRQSFNRLRFTSRTCMLLNFTSSHGRALDPHVRFDCQTTQPKEHERTWVQWWPTGCTLYACAFRMAKQLKNFPSQRSSTCNKRAGGPREVGLSLGTIMDVSLLTTTCYALAFGSTFAWLARSQAKVQHF